MKFFSQFSKTAPIAISLIVIILVAQTILFQYQTLEQMEGTGSTTQIELHSKCPVIPVGNCTFWSRTKPKPNETTSWVWTNACLPMGYEGKARQNITIPTISGMKRRLDVITHNETSVVFFGSSHIRELHKEFVRLHNGLDYNGGISKVVRMVGSGIKSPACDPKRTGYKDGLYGVDLDKCGLPGKRMVPELGENVAIGFKTFLHTPIADNLFVDWLTNHSLRHPQVIVTDVGMWGPRGNKTAGSLNYTMSLEDEIDYNLKWLRTTFPTGAIIFIVEHQFYDVGIEPSVNPRLIDFVDNDKQSVLVRKDFIMQKIAPRMKCDHGCSGPVLVAIAHLIMDWLEVALAGPGDCITKTKKLS